MTKSWKIHLIIGILLPILAFSWLATTYNEEFGYYCLDFSCTTMNWIFLGSGFIGLLFIKKGINNYVNRNKLSKDEVVEQKLRNSDKKIESLEKKLGKIEDEKIKSQKDDVV